MTITFENDYEVIVYAIEKIISYARDNQYLFLAQSIWWISSIVGLQEGLVIHIDNLKLPSELRHSSNIHRQSVFESPKATEENTRVKPDLGTVHQERISQIDK
jgi:hypothetical protein